MHRTSLGSPETRSPIPTDLHSPERRRRDDPLPLAYSDDGKSDKSPITPAPARSVHLIPLVVLFCFLVLFLVSHDPSPADLLNTAGAGASGRFAVFRGSGRIMAAKKEVVVALGSHRSLHHLPEPRHRARKLGKFH